MTLTRHSDGYTHTGRDLYTSPASIDLQGQLVQCKEKSRVPSDRYRLPDTGRGTIRGFSSASRRRLLQYAARLKTDGRPLFVTLTYAKDWPLVNEANNHRRAFMERIRRIAPQASGIWRIELQRRGAPHFHLILYGLPWIHYRAIQYMWADIVGYAYSNGELPGGAPFTRIEKARTKRGATNYVAKYMAKVPDSIDGFISSAYLHGHRHWGWFNKRFLPWAPQRLIRTIHGQNDVYWTFKRYLRRYKNGKHVRRGTFTMFVQDAERWLALWHDICMNGHCLE